MIPRVRLATDSLRVSVPGIDVTKAASDQLLFDSQGTPYNGAWMSGKILSSAFTETTSNVNQAGGGYTLHHRTYRLDFGKTFPTIPRLLTGVIFNNSYVQNFVCQSVSNAVVSGKNSGAGITLTVTVANDHADYVIDSLVYTGTEYNRFVDCPYLVFTI